MDVPDKIIEEDEERSQSPVKNRRPSNKLGASRLGDEDESVDLSKIELSFNKVKQSFDESNSEPSNPERLEQVQKPNKQNLKIDIPQESTKIKP